MDHRISWLVGCLIVFMLFSVDVFATGPGPVTVDVEGYASIVGGRKDAAREGALNNAFRRAIEQVVGVMVSSKTVVQDSALLNDKILSKSSGFIKTYKITSEIFEADACRVNVKATVSTVRLEKGLNDVGLLSAKLGKPRIAIIMTEQNIGNDAPSGSLADSAVNAGIAESVLHTVLTKRGYNLVDRETLVAIARREGALSATGGSVPTEVALQVAAGGGAEVVIIGQAVAKAGASAVSGTNMRTSQANVSARVVDADTGHLVASYSASATAAHVNPTAGGAEAIKRSAQELAENLNRQIVAKWSRKVAGTRTARVVIKGVKFSDISRLRDLMLERLNHVEKTEERGFRDGTLSLDAEITGSARELAEEITQANMGGYKCEVISFTANTLNLQLHKR
jgi:hypothetical protein